LLKNRRLALRRKRSYVRDVFKAWNDDWTAAAVPPPKTKAEASS
jgi:hypothetical protein